MGKSILAFRPAFQHSLSNNDQSLAGSGVNARDEEKAPANLKKFSTFGSFLSVEGGGQKGEFADSVHVPSRLPGLLVGLYQFGAKFARA